MANSAMERRREERAKQLEDLVANRESRAEDQEDGQYEDIPPQSEDSAEDDANETGDKGLSKEQVERLQKKSSALESENATLRKELESMRKTKEPAKTQAQLDKELEEELREEVGSDTWDYMDDASKRAMITLAKRTAKREGAVKTEIDAAFQSRDEQARSRDFVKRLDDGLRERGYRLKFVTLVNSDGFSTWMDKSRRNIAIFEDAMKHRDDEALNDMLQVIDEYYRSKTKTQNNTSPQSTANKTKASVKSDKVTEEQYLAAVKDKRHPSKRQRAREIIAKYKEQNNG